MLITKRNEYALQAMVLLAQPRAGRPATAKALAQTLGTSPAFMSKIVQRLAAAGLVHGRRGRHGGLSLARPASRIRIREILEAADGPLLVSQCMVDGRCAHLACPLYPALRKVQAQLDRYLNNARLDQLLKRGGG